MERVSAATHHKVGCAIKLIRFVIQFVIKLVFIVDKEEIVNWTSSVQRHAILTHVGCSTTFFGLVGTNVFSIWTSDQVIRCFNSFRTKSFGIKLVQRHWVNWHYLFTSFEGQKIGAAAFIITIFDVFLN